MLHAPTSEAKTETTQSKSQLVPQPEQELHPRLLSAAGLSSSSGASGVGSGTSPEVQQRQTLAGMQSTHGNQAVLRMLHSPQQVARMTPLRPSQGVMLQRKCACGGSSEAEGECAECKAKHEGTLQRRAANPTVSPAAGAIQTKLAINQPGDEYEQEADHLADQVIRMPGPQLQRACACGEACATCQTEPDQEHESLQTKRIQASDTGQIAALPIVDEVLRSPGQPLDPATRAFMEPRFGHDFSRVRVHSGAFAEQSTQDVNANAYTVGQDIVFGAGQYAPATQNGRRLLAHELTHVVQQSGADRISVGQSNVKHGRSPIPLPQLQVAWRIQRKGSGAMCTGITIRLPNSITFEGTEGPIKASVETLDALQPGMYKVSYDAVKGQLLVDTPGGTLLKVSVTTRGTPAQIGAAKARFYAYVRSLSTPVTLTVIEAGSGGGSGGSGAGGTSHSPTAKAREGGLKETGGEKESGQKGGVPEGTGVKKQETSEPQPSGGTGGEQKGGEKTSPEYAAKLKALLDGIETKPLDPETERQLKSILDKLSLDDIALFKQLAVKDPGGDMEGFLRSLRLFVSTKDVYQKQKPPEAQATDEIQKILADALNQYHDDMSQDEKERLARATIRSLSNEQLKNISAQQIAEGIIRVDKQLKGMADEMDKGMNDLIHGTGWERVAGGARTVKGAASFWGFLALAAIVASAFIPVLNVAVLAAHAFAAGLVVYAAANIQLEAETKAASRAKSPEDFQKRILNATTARNEVIINGVMLALPLAGKFIGKLPLPAALNRVNTVLKTAGNALKGTSGKAFGSVKTSVLEALSSARADMQPYLIQFRATIGSIARRIRGASGAEFLKEFKSTPELQGLVSDETLKAMEHLKADELAVAKKGVLEQLDNAPAVAEETIKSMQAQMADLEKKVQAANTAQDLQKVLGEGTKTSEPEQVAKQAGTQAVENVVQSRVKKISNLSVEDVKEDTISLLQDVQKLPNTNPNKQSVLNELKEILKKTQELEKKQGKADISKELEDISRRHEELDDLVADAIAKMNESRRPQVAPPAQKVAPPPPGSRKQPPQLMQGQEYNIAHAFDYKYRELYIRDPKGGPSFKLDGYEPGKWIVSRKNQQLSEISLSEANSHIAEFADKYAKGRLIDSSVPSSGLQTGGAPATGGQKLSGTLQGQYVLEVPVQSKPVPVDILVAAKNADVIIRDVAGKIYSLPSPTLP